MGQEEIASSDEALQQPMNLTAFIEAYSPYADIKFVVLHRPFLDTIASHSQWDGGPEIHSNIIRAFMLILGRFLNNYRFDLVNGSPLWKLVCVERITAKNYDTREDVIAVRNDFIANLSNFLGWPNGDCPHCFDSWRDSRKNALGILGPYADMMREHMKVLDGVWPPSSVEGVYEPECGS